MSQGDHVWSTDMLEVSGRRVGEVGDGPLVPLTYCDENDIHKKLNLGSNTINLLSEHQKEADGLLPAEDVERWELHGSDLDDLPVEREKSSTKLPHSSTSKIKRLVSTNSKKINGMQEVWDILLRYPLELLKTHDLPCEEAVEKQEITTRLQSHEQSSTELTQCCEFRPRELKSRLLEQRVLKLRELPIQKLVIAPLVKFDTHVEATEASKHEIVANAYKLGYLDCRNSASPCCPLEHEDEAVEEQIADEAAMEEDNS
ncbi:unnamed protein product [Prunus armeniaca]